MVSFAGEVMVENETPTLTEPVATPGDSIDQRISGQPEEPYLLNEKQANVFLTSSLMKQLLKSPNKSTLINDLIKNPAQKNENSRSVPCATSKFRKSCSTER